MSANLASDIFATELRADASCSRGFLGRIGLTLADQMSKRNDANHPIAGLDVEGVRLTAPEALPGKIDGVESAGIATLSRPAYTNDGKALVYASYVCGGLCGYGWFVLLEQRNGEWIVAGRHWLWIS